MNPKAESLCFLFLFFHLFTHFKILVIIPLFSSYTNCNMDKLRRIHMSKKYPLTFGLLLLIFMLLHYPNLCLQAAQDGLLLWFNKVLPSLLPFMILINILVPLNGLQPFISWCTPFSKYLWHLPGESLFAFLIGIIAGYPMGAKVIKSLYTQHKLTQEEAERTLCFCNNCGPLFIIGTIGTAMLSQAHLGYFLFFIHLLSACIMSLLVTRNLPSTSSSTYKQSSSPAPNFSKLLNLAVMNAMDTIVCVGGYIILFSVLLALMTQTPFSQELFSKFLNPSIYSLFQGILSSCFELSNGVYSLSKLPLTTYSLALISAAIGFGGICVYFQALFVLEDTSLNTRPFFISKSIQGVLSFALTLLLSPVYLKYTENTVYTSNTSFTFSLPSIFLATLLLLISVIIPQFLFKKTSHPYHFKQLSSYKTK